MVTVSVMWKRKRKLILTDKQIAARKRRLKVEEFMMRGLSDLHAIAARLGVSHVTIYQDQRWIREYWLKRDIKTSRIRQTYRIKQLEFAAYESITAWERSKQNAEEITTEYIPRACPDCKGNPGMKDGVEGATEWCMTCDGNGKILTERMTKRVKGKSGDPAHMANYQSAIREIAKIEGHYPTVLRPKKLVNNQELHIHQGIDLSKAPPELILRAREAMLQLQQSVTDGLVEEDVLDVESKEPEAGIRRGGRVAEGT